MHETKDTTLNILKPLALRHRPVNIASQGVPDRSYIILAAQTRKIFTSGIHWRDLSEGAKLTIKAWVEHPETQRRGRENASKLADLIHLLFGVDEMLKAAEEYPDRR
jgi:hypothetical protein